ncbi:GNAT family N-acetyltransferase, partial [Candidatus Peregrinibacteria bacterium]|nr:GNAT family N-acetyltransferase [Candidatus Peregrinibacteria bacterium]
KHAGQEIGILPLQYEPKEGLWEFFGGPFMEGNSVWVKNGYEKHVKGFYQAAGEPVWLDYLIGDDEFTRSLPIDDGGYALDLSKFSGSADVIERHLQGRLRKHVRSAYKEILAKKPEIIYNRWADLEKLFYLNKLVFGVESSFYDEHEEDVYRDLIKLPYEWLLFSVDFDGETRAVSLGVAHKKCYYFLAVGYERGEIKQLNQFLGLQSIDEAKRLGAEKIDFGYHDCGWKERWNLERIEYHQYVCPPDEFDIS